VTSIALSFFKLAADKPVLVKIKDPKFPLVEIRYGSQQGSCSAPYTVPYPQPPPPTRVVAPPTPKEGFFSLLWKNKEKKKKETNRGLHNNKLSISYETIHPKPFMCDYNKYL
jgi:hypothetical protein